MTLTEFDDVDWFTSPERKEAVDIFLSKWWLDKPQGYVPLMHDNKVDDFIRDDGDLFTHSKEFANARHAYRKRVNGQNN